MLEGGQLYRQGFSRTRPGEGRCEAHRDTDREKVKNHRQTARHDGGKKQRDDRVLREHAVEDQHQRGRNDHAQGAPGGDSARCDGACVAAVQHFGERDPGHGGGGGDRGPRYRAEPGAGANRGVYQAALEMPERIIGQSIQFSRQATRVGEIAH